MKLEAMLLTTFLLALMSPGFAITADENHVVLAGDEGPGMIFFPRQVEEGPDGNLYVLDSGDSFIKVYSAAGQYLRKLGGEGEGPGEFQRTDGATFGFTTKNQLFFSEYFGGHRWLTIMELNGDLVQTLSPQLDVAFGIQAATSLDDGGFLVQLVYNATPRSQGNYFLYDQPVSLARMDSSGSILSEIVNTKYTQYISYSPSGATTNLPFTPVFVWTPVDDDQVLWSDGMDPLLPVFDFSGHLLFRIETPLPQPEQVSKKDLEQWKANREEEMLSVDPRWWGRWGKVIHEYKKPLFSKPVLRGISRTPKGNLLVEGWSSPEMGATTTWLLNGQGKELADATVAARQVHYSNHFLLFITSDEEDNPEIHAIEHFGNEIKALSRMEEIVGSLLESRD